MSMPRLLVTVTGPPGHRDPLVTVVHEDEPLLSDEGAESYPLNREPGPPLLERAATCPDARSYGTLLFHALLGPVWRAITALAADWDGVELALKLPMELQPLIWEAMYAEDRPLAAHPTLLVAVTRLIPAPYEAGPRTVRKTPRILFASGAKLTDPVIRPGAMFLGLVRECESQGLAMTRLAEETSADRLHQRYAAFQPDLVHLVAHGRADPVDGETWVELAGTWTKSGQLGAALTSGASPPLAVVLSVCHSGAHGGLDRTSGLVETLIRGGVPIVVAVAGEVTEYACRLFSRRFVQALLRGEAVAEAAAHGRRAALIGERHPEDRLDWAMPTLFVADTLPADFKAVDPGEVNRIRSMAGKLELLEGPAYVGRGAIFDTLDGLITPGSERTFLGITSGGAFGNIGGTRLLREIGFRLLQSGHLPLLLAPFNDVQSAPHSLRQVVGEILAQMVRTSERLSLPLPRLRSLRAAGSVAPFELDQDEVMARQQVKSAVAEFATAAAPLLPSAVDALLAADLSDLAGAAVRSLGRPFGPHTRVVVLAEALHLWVGALGWTEPAKGLLDLLTPDGLGTAARPAPVVVTAALGECSPLRNFREEKAGMPWCAFHDLEPLSDEEASLGFQWVLMQPWHPKDAFRLAYYAAPDSDPVVLRESFRLHLEGRPGLIKTELYRMAQLLALHRVFLSHDDTEGWSAYARVHGLRHEP
ncbi:CHAT domain-containing protein [Streptosporangium sp. NPDC051023]|uniref:CHAT domain-containing protein n=1 Tax=Streptosporangium sp. NPDC051023 TaxID=3155410 RepID=UPI00344BA0AD